jgi:hypothetical protein
LWLEYNFLLVVYGWPGRPIKATYYRDFLFVVSV